MSKEGGGRQRWIGGFLMMTQLVTTAVAILDRSSGVSLICIVAVVVVG